ERIGLVPSRLPCRPWGDRLPPIRRPSTAAEGRAIDLDAVALGDGVEAGRFLHFEGTLLAASVEIPEHLGGRAVPVIGKLAQEADGFALPALAEQRQRKFVVLPRRGPG